MQIDELMRVPTNPIKLGQLLDTLIKSNTYIEYVFQKPGQYIVSPPGNGAAHIVISTGPLLVQLAWNLSFTIPGGLQSLSFWCDRYENYGHASLNNGSQATQSVVPLYTMQHNGYDFNLQDRITHYHNSIKQLRQLHPSRRYDVQVSSSSTDGQCKHCLFRQDWLLINNRCIHCYFKNPKILKELQSS